MRSVDHGSQNDTAIPSSPGPVVAIIILNWNQKDDTLACLRSLQNLEYSRTHIIVVDNGSHDGSVESIRDEFPEVQVIAQVKNYGCSGGRNIGAKLALQLGADYVLFLDNDTAVAPNFVTLMVQAIVTDQRVGIAGPAIYYFDQRDTIWTAGASIDRRLGRTHPLYAGVKEEQAPRQDYRVDFVAGCALMAKRDVFEAIGYFDEDYFIYFEETDWCFRAQQAGFKAVVVPAARIWHKESQSLGGRQSPRKIYYMSRNQLLFVDKRFPVLQKYVLLGWHIISQMLIVAVQYMLPKYSAQRRERKARILALRDFALRHYGEQELGPLS